jgi:lipoprotein-releasing system permease protein
MIVGGPVFGIRSNEKGQSDVQDWLFTLWCRLEVVPLSDDTRSLSGATPSSNIYWVVDISRTKLFQLDDAHVFVPFEVLQKDLHMTEQTYEEIVGGERVQRFKPARCSEIQINLKPGADRMAMVSKINATVQDIASKYEKASLLFSPVRVEPWEKKQEKFLGAVENEISLMTFLLGLISLVAIFLIFCILYMIVVEKTRDIGIIKSVGATSQGIAAIFLGYGAAIGTVGGVAGVLAGWGIMTWINEIHEGVSKLIGKPIWDPEVYAFDKIPDTVDPKTAAVVLAVAIASAVIGAVVPAIRAARLNPVEALRFE